MMILPGQVARAKKTHCPCVSVAKILTALNGDPLLVEIAPTLLQMVQKLPSVKTTFKTGDGYGF